MHRIERWVAIAAIVVVAVWIGLLVVRRARRVTEGERLD